MNIRLICLLLVFFQFGCLKQPGFAQNLPFENSQYITVDNLDIHYRTWISNDNSQNPWILLVHGFSGSTYTWNKNIDSLLYSGYNIVAVDVPPFGYSDKNRKYNHSIDNRAELLWAFAQKVNPKTSWHLVGHSMGGGIVAAMAIIHPERVNKVVLVAPALFGRLQPGRSFRQRLIAFSPVEWTLAGIGKLFLIRKKRVEKLIESAYGEKGTHKDIMAYYKPLKQKGMARAIISTFSRSNPKQTLLIADLKSETLAIWGQNDSWVPFERMKPYTDAIEDLSIVLIKDTGHNPMETDAKLFNRIVLDFLSF